jgi:hypothetical protein
VGVVLNRVSDFSGEADYYQYYPGGDLPAARSRP